jgi:hypothetical protein
MEMAKMFCYDPIRNQVTNLGVAVSVLDVGATVMSSVMRSRPGRPIIFGEDDDLGHLWLYFPKIV